MDNEQIAQVRNALLSYEKLRDSIGGCTDGGCLVKDREECIRTVGVVAQLTISRRRG